MALNTMKIILTKPVKKWFDKENYISESDLLMAAEEVVKGHFEANLGGHLFKKRIANSATKGKSGGSRLIIGYQIKHHFYYLYVFNKNDRGSISDKELKALKARVKILLNLGRNELEKAIQAKILFEIGSHTDE